MSDGGMQAFFDNKEDRDRACVSEAAAAPKSKCPQCEQPTVTVQPPKEDSANRRAECGDCGYKFKLVPSSSDAKERRRDRSPARDRSRSPERPGGQAPSVDIVLQYGKVPLHRDDLNMKALVTLKPPEHQPDVKEAHVVLCLDESLSMHGPSMELLQQFMDNLVDKGVPGLKLWLRILFFGGEVVDKKISTVEMMELNDTSRPLFREIVDSMSARQGSTNISAALLRGVEICKSHQDHLRDCGGGQALTQAAHVICLTDGQANEGLTSGSLVHKQVTKAIDCQNIFVHMLGLGGNLHAPFMTEVTDKGNAGVFSVAPDPTKLTNAFEEIFGIALKARDAFRFQITDANGTRVEHRGMLCKERSVLVDVTLANHFVKGTHENAVQVVFYRDGSWGEAGNIAYASVTYEGVEYANPNERVKEMMQRVEIEQEANRIQSESGSMAAASASLREYSDMLTSQGGYGAAALKRIQAMVTETEEAEVTYRSLSRYDEGQASLLFAARSCTQSQYT